VDFYRWWQKHFSREQTTVKFFFYKLETKKKIFSDFKILGSSPSPQAPPSNNHENEDLKHFDVRLVLGIFDKKTPKRKWLCA